MGQKHRRSKEVERRWKDIRRWQSEEKKKRRRKIAVERARQVGDCNYWTAGGWTGRDLEGLTAARHPATKIGPGEVEKGDDI